METRRYMLENWNQHKGQILTWYNVESPIPQNRAPEVLLNQTKFMYSSPFFLLFSFPFFLLFLFFSFNSLTETVITWPGEIILSEMHNLIPIILEIGILTLSLKNDHFYQNGDNFLI